MINHLACQTQCGSFSAAKEFWLRMHILCQTQFQIRAVLVVGLVDRKNVWPKKKNAMFKLLQVFRVSKVRAALFLSR